MQTSGFTNTPVSKFLVTSIVLSSLLASITDTKYFFSIAVVPHLWVYRQFWRLLTWQACYTNATEVLFASMTFYQLRVVERLWGSRKFAVRLSPSCTAQGLNSPAKSARMTLSTCAIF